MGETIEKIRIGHDGSGFGDGWHLAHVAVRKLHDSGKVCQIATQIFMFASVYHMKDGCSKNYVVPVVSTGQIGIWNLCLLRVDSEDLLPSYEIFLQ